jgi:hypothetical protein
LSGSIWLAILRGMGRESSRRRLRIWAVPTQR